MNARNRVEDAGSKLGRCGDGSRIISLSGGAPRVARGSGSARINPTSKCAQSVPEEFSRRPIRCTLRSPNLGDLVNSKNLVPLLSVRAPPPGVFSFLELLFLFSPLSAIVPWSHVGSTTVAGGPAPRPLRLAGSPRWAGLART